MILYIIICFLFIIIKKLIVRNIEMQKTIKSNNKDILELKTIVSKQQYHYYKEVKINNNLRRNINEKFKEIINEINEIKSL
jgi:hypothetical protein